MQPQTNGVSGAALRSARWRSEAGPLCASWPGPWALLPSPEGLRVPEALSLGSWPPPPGTCSGCCSRVRCPWPRAHPWVSAMLPPQQEEDGHAKPSLCSRGGACRGGRGLRSRPRRGWRMKRSRYPAVPSPAVCTPAPPLERGVRSPASASPAGAATSSEKTQGNQRGGLPRHVTHMATTSSR